MNFRSVSVSRTHFRSLPFSNQSEIVAFYCPSFYYCIKQKHLRLHFIWFTVFFFFSLSCFLPSKQTKRRLMLTSRAHIISSDENGCRARKKSQHIKDTLVINFKTKEAVFILAAIFILTHSLTRSHARILSENAKQISNGWFASLCAHALCFVYFFICVVSFLSTHRVFFKHLECSTLCCSSNVAISKGKQITSLCDDTMIGLLTKTEILSSFAFFRRFSRSLAGFHFICSAHHLHCDPESELLPLSLWPCVCVYVQKLNWCVITKQCELTGKMKP